MNGIIAELRGENFFDLDIDIFVNREQEAFSLGQHTHDFVEINIVGEGCGFHYIEDQVVQVKQGDVFLIPIGTSHVFRPSSPERDKVLVVYNCIFRNKAMENWSHHFSENSETIRMILYPQERKGRWLQFHDKHSTLHNMIHNMHCEYLKRNQGCEIILNTTLIQLLIMLQRMEMEKEYMPSPNDKLDDVMHYIKNHYSKNITAQNVADHFYMSISHFQRQFKKLTGHTFIQYLQNIRIQKCCELLESTDISIHEIANLVGYLDMKFFHALFRKKTGVTPRKYRQNFQEWKIE
ncbi:helix-turn-helix domain-containing protein [Paenibacillus arenilitoris]|uniref:Helix-turn-helix transcriptional regulator n=1 Tax=Paenibacillus arenilitoris TaxID=2772299 RepID=A0A927CME4_9BACL|nr:AraC family transcriptional regulator [Paenibacillus arenilitoris]MBD2868511.1 helix-turn-helix transcriptional regulator [Paenibacillus arenilitoris]